MYFIWNSRALNTLSFYIHCLYLLNIYIYIYIYIREVTFCNIYIYIYIYIYTWSHVLSFILIDFISYLKKNQLPYQLFCGVYFRIDYTVRFLYSNVKCMCVLLFMCKMICVPFLWDPYVHNIHARADISRCCSYVNASFDLCVCVCVCACVCLCMYVYRSSHVIIWDRVIARVCMHTWSFLPPVCVSANMTFDQNEPEAFKGDNYE